MSNKTRFPKVSIDPKYFKTDKSLASSCIEDMMREYYETLEAKIKVALKPKPRWLPQTVYLYILKKLIYLEEIKK